jgi:hypothetical protein
MSYFVFGYGRGGSLGWCCWLLVGCCFLSLFLDHGRIGLQSVRSSSHMMIRTIEIERRIERMIPQVGHAASPITRRPWFGQMGKELDASAYNPLQSVRRLLGYGLLLLL